MKRSFEGIFLIVDNFLKLSQQLPEIFGHKVSSNWMYLRKIIGGLPLMDVKLSVGIVETTVVIEYSSSHLQISKTNASGKSSQIINGLIVLSEKIKNLFSLRILDVKNFWFGQSGVIWAIGDRPWVIVAVESVEEHMIRQ